MNGFPSPPVVVVGAGFAGATVARLLAEAGWPVQVVEQRPHLGGNAYDALDDHGVLVHRYGPHIFHSNSPRIIEFLSRFTAWRPYEHRVLAEVDGQLLPIPINRTTLNRLYGLDLDEAEAQAFLDRARIPCEHPKTSEEAVLAAVGPDLCDKFFRGYTRKQWGLELSQLAASVAARIPTRCNDDDRYFTDRFQQMPAEGYSALFARLLDHPGITCAPGCDFLRNRDAFPARHTVFTGPIDAYYAFSEGPLPYRSLRFEHEHLPGVACFQPVGTVNYPNAHAYTRITEFRHLTGQIHSGTSIVREYPLAAGDPYYPVPTPDSQKRYRRYAERAAQETAVTFVGRLAEYRYYNMDQAIASAMTTAQRLIEKLGPVPF